MNQDTFNSIIKESIKDLMESGIKEIDICDVLLSRAYISRFHTFINEENTLLGFKPLTKICDSLGYEFLIVPVKSNELDKKELINNSCNEFVNIFKETLYKHLSNKPQIERKKRGPSENGIKVNDTYNYTITDLLGEINNIEES